MATAPLHRPAVDKIGPAWASFIQEWDRTLRFENKSANTVRIYTLVAAQLAAWLATQPDQVEPTEITARHAHTTYRSLLVFFKWLVDEDEIDGSPMDHTKAPIVPEKLVPILADDITKALLDQCTGRDPDEPTRPRDHPAPV